MPFRLTSVPVTFMDLMNSFKAYLVEFLIMFIDDIYLFSKSEAHEWHLDKTL